MIHRHVTVQNVQIGKLAHVYLRPTHCETVETVFWKK